MCAVEKPLVSAALPFDVWKSALRRDCELNDTLCAFDAMGDPVLLFLWHRGLAPSVKAIIEDDPDYHKDNSAALVGLSLPCEDYGTRRWQALRGVAATAERPQVHNRPMRRSFDQ